MESINKNPSQQFSPFVDERKTYTLFEDESICSQPIPMNDNQGDSHHSDCESGTSRDDTKEQDTLFSDAGFTRVECRESVYRVMGQKFIPALSSCGFDAEIEAIYKNNFSTVMGEARQKSFGIYLRAMETKHGGSANQAYAWYGTSMAEALAVVDNGFRITAENGVYGQGIYLSPTQKPLNSLLSATPDADGRRCVLLCRVLLGRPEVICPGSRQYKPCSNDFDSGVDSLSSPTTYVVWSSHMNTHILLEMVIIFKANFCGGSKKVPSSAWVPFSALIRALSKVLPVDAIELMNRVHGEYKKQKISRMEMVRGVRNIAGDRLLLEIIKTYRGRKSLLHPHYSVC